MEPHNKLVRNKLSSYLKGKRVVLVGPAPSVIDSAQAALIDSYDVVVRLNKALPIPKDLQKDIGTRCDILYNCMNPSDDCGGTININTLNKYGVKFLVGAYPPVDSVGTTKLRIKTDNLSFYNKNRNNWRSFCYTDKTHFLSLWKLMRLPNTGTMAILDLLRFDIKELYITGITFFKVGYIRSYRDYDEKGIMNHLKKFNLHNPNKQLDYACGRLLKEPRVTMDNTLTSILTQHCGAGETDGTDGTYGMSGGEDDDVGSCQPQSDYSDQIGGATHHDGYGDGDSDREEIDENHRNIEDEEDSMDSVNTLIIEKDQERPVTAKSDGSDLIVEAEADSVVAVEESKVINSGSDKKCGEKKIDDFDDNLIGQIKRKIPIYSKK